MGIIESVLKEDSPFVRKEKEVGNHVISYQEYVGNNGQVDRTFIVSHGAFATSEFMAIVGQALIKQFEGSKVILVDLPWHGHSTSTEPVEGATINTYSSIMNQFVDLLLYEGQITGTLHWVGWSMGGSIGMLLNLAGVEIKELTLLNSSPIWETIEGLAEAVPTMQDVNTVAETFKQVVTNDLEGNLSGIQKELILEQYDILISSPETMVNDMPAIFPDNYDIMEDLRHINAKTLVISGSKDGVALLDMQTVFTDNIPKSEKVLYADGHCMVIKPQIVKDFVHEMKEYFKK